METLEILETSQPRIARESTARPGRASRPALALALWAAACVVLVACASKPPAPAVQNRCPPDRPGCTVEVVFTDVGLGERVARLDGRLTAAQPAATYRFEAAAGERLRMQLSGAPVHLVLTRPNGQTDGPGLPSEMTLAAKGKYVLRVTPANPPEANKTSDFHLELRVTGKP